MFILLVIYNSENQRLHSGLLMGSILSSESTPRHYCREDLNSELRFLNRKHSITRKIQTQNWKDLEITCVMVYVMKGK